MRAILRRRSVLFVVECRARGKRKKSIRADLVTTSLHQFPINYIYSAPVRCNFRVTRSSHIKVFFSIRSLVVRVLEHNNDANKWWMVVRLFLYRARYQHNHIIVEHLLYGRLVLWVLIFANKLIKPLVFTTWISISSSNCEFIEYSKNLRFFFLCSYNNRMPFHHQ